MSRRPVAPPPKQRSGTVRTVVLVAIGAVLAGLIIGRGLSNRTTSTGGSTTTKTTVVKANGKTTTTAQQATTAPTTIAVSLGSFTAIVLNGNGIPGTAAARTTELGGLGVKVEKATDAVRKDFTASQFYALDPASEPAARLLAARTGIAYAGGYPTATPPAAVDKLGKATIVLLLAKDVANQALADKGASAATTAAPAAATTATATTVRK